MTIVNIKINGREYHLACDDGQEEHLRLLADDPRFRAARVDDGEVTAIDPYAAEHPAEFFAVTSEVFFETPELLRAEYPAVYTQMRLFYRQDPAAGLPT